MCTCWHMRPVHCVVLRLLLTCTAWPARGSFQQTLSGTAKATDWPALQMMTPGQSCSAPWCVPLCSDRHHPFQPPRLSSRPLPAHVNLQIKKKHLNYFILKLQIKFLHIKGSKERYLLGQNANANFWGHPLYQATKWHLNNSYMMKHLMES